jgi:hypothetical protein
MSLHEGDTIAHMFGIRSQRKQYRPKPLPEQAR